MASCPRGPRPNGFCGADSELCVPIRTFRGRRRAMVLSLAFLGLALFVACLAADPKEFLKPGELSHSHAVIFSSQSGVNQCAACHPNTKFSFTKWFANDSVFHNRLAQTDSCVVCHHVKMPEDVARLPHNLPRERLLEIRDAWRHWKVDGPDAAGGDSALERSTTLTASTDNSIESIQCASCHREHGGVHAIMTTMSNAQCQSCHSRTFESFRDGHPDWQSWPHVGAKVIVFDHTSHQRLHFPKSKPNSISDRGTDSPQSATSASDHASTPGEVLGRVFDCRQCHPGSAVTENDSIGLASLNSYDDSEPLRTVSFETGCADCHSDGIRVQANERIDLFALPTITDDAAARLIDWPEAATGFFDGQISGLTRWLIQKNSRTADAIKQLPSGGSITQVDSRRSEQVSAAVIAAEAIRDAMDQFATQGSNVVSKVGDHRGDAAMREILRTVPPQLVADATLRWFGSDRPVAMTNGQSTNGLPVLARPIFNDDDDLLGTAVNGDPLLDDPLLRHESQGTQNSGVAKTGLGGMSPFDPSVGLPDGGWFRDDLRLAISYRGKGHADPVLKAAVELAASLPEHEPVRVALLAEAAVASCVHCHVGAMHPTGARWKNSAARPQSKALTKFTHKPHFHLPQLTDCTHCHATHADDEIIAERMRRKTTKDYDAADEHGFESIGKSACISCHTKGAAGDHCTQCHRYHSTK